jgi:hypothetical protein
MTYKQLSNRELNKSKHILHVDVLPFIKPNLFSNLLSFDDVSYVVYNTKIDCCCRKPKPISVFRESHLICTTYSVVCLTKITSKAMQ